MANQGEIFELKAGEISPSGEIYGKIKAIPYSNFRATSAIDDDEITNEPVDISLEEGGELTGEWTNIRLLYGRVLLYPVNGCSGVQGEPGQNGLSAYEVWLAQGNTGTEQEFLDSLKGADSDPSDSINIGNSDLEIAPGINRKISLQPGLDSESGTLLAIGGPNNNNIYFTNDQDFGFKFGINAPVSIQNNDLNVIFGNINVYNGGLGISEDLRVNGLGKIIKGNTEISIDGITTNGIVSDAGINKFNGAGIEAMGSGGKFSKIFFSDYDNIRIESIDDDPLNFLRITMSDDSQINLKKQGSIQTVQGLADALTSIGLLESSTIEPSDTEKGILNAYNQWLNAGNGGDVSTFLNSLNKNLENRNMNIGTGVSRIINLAHRTSTLKIQSLSNEIFHGGFDFLNLYKDSIQFWTEDGNDKIALKKDVQFDALTTFYGETNFDASSISANGGTSQFNGGGLQALGYGIDVSQLWVKKRIDIKSHEASGSISVSDAPLGGESPVGAEGKTLFITLADDHIIELKKSPSVSTIQGLADVLTSIGLLENSTIDTTVQNGTDGLSAYEVWLNQGNEGTEQDFLDSLKGEDGASFSDELNASFISMKYDSTYPNLILVPSTPLKDSGGVKEFKPIVTLNSDEITLDFTGGLLNGNQVDVNSIAPILQVTSGPLDTILRAVPDRTNNIIRIKIHGTPPDGDTPLNSLVSFNFLSMSNLFKK
ncbi:hypothetical protein [Brumimicrobium aurantiacum]|uniref:Uncharacterized protein n=1 Tax=Brumimicrobium aurantiacum TaxID=1737063 RepID=A0A3E1EUR1_9FLAO|nr:hypothetical protein [Brumimicrobium aurantiacum]RFC53242.1 hypothetical protein DXU93_14350 [Brumimicrobium aurantiacum]